MKRDYSLVPEGLRAASRWLVYRPVGDKKPPVGKDGRAAKDWQKTAGPYVDIFPVLKEFEDAGPGFLLGEEWGGVDLDSCRSPDTGLIDPRAQFVVDECEAYTEVSPSGKGLKIFGRATFWLEINFSDSTRVTISRKPHGYFAVTGQRVGERMDLPDLEPTLNTLYGFFAGGETTKPERSEPLPDRIPRGTQNDTLFREACRHRAAGKSEDEIYGILVALKGRCDPQPSNQDLRTLAHSACRYEQGQDDGHPQTETGDAEFFALVNAGRLCYDHRRGRWLLFDGSRWRPQTDGEVERLSIEAIRLRQRAAVGNKEKMMWAVRGESRSRRANMVVLAQSVLPLADSGETWDADPWLLGVQNGVIDLRTGELRAATHEDRITMQTRFPYEKDAKAPLWDEKVKEILKDDPELEGFIHKALGYSVTGVCVEEAFFLCIGEGRNGKGTIVNTVGEVLGDYTDSLSFHSLERDTHGARSSTNDIAKLHRKRYVTASETYGGRLDEARVKTMTGRDPLTARFLYKEEFTFVPEFKLWLSVNHPPKVRDDSEGFWSRPRVVPFRQSYKVNPDKTLKDRLLQEGPGILRWLVEGCLRWQREALGLPAGVTMAVDSYRRSEEMLSEFYEECCTVSESTRVKPSELYDEYVRWADRMRLRVKMGSKTFAQNVRRRFKAITVQGAVYYSGVGVAKEGAHWDQGLGGGI